MEKFYLQELRMFLKRNKENYHFQSKDDTPEDNFKDKELRAALLETLKKLEKTEALIIQLYYVEELNVYEIAKILDVTTGRVSQIKKNAISKLRAFINSEDQS